MAHCLEKLADGSYSHAYVGEVPWHGLGTRVEADLPPEAIMKAAGLDWEVQKVPLFAEIGGQKIQTKAEALIRSTDNRILSTVTDSWNPVQNAEAFDFFSEFVQAGDMEMHTAGSLHGGQVVWALAKLKDTFFDIFGGDRTDGYLLFSNPHKFGKAIDIRFTATRVVCNNTLTLALESGSTNMVKLSHRREFNPDMVKETLGMSTSKLDKYREAALFLGSKRYNEENIVDYFNRIFPKTTEAAAEEGKLASRAARIANDILETQPGAEFAEGSFWQLYNAVTFTTDHLLGRSADTRVASSWFGSNKDRKVKALNLALEMAEAA